METWINIFGYGAAVCMVCGYLPQAIHTIRTRETDGIAMPTFLLMFLGSLFFIVQGIMINNVPLWITNSITAICAGIVFFIKLHNDHLKRVAPHKLPSFAKEEAKRS